MYVTFLLVIALQKLCTVHTYILPPAAELNSSCSVCLSVRLSHEDFFFFSLLSFFFFFFFYIYIYFLIEFKRNVYRGRAEKKAQ